MLLVRKTETIPQLPSLHRLIDSAKNIIEIDDSNGNSRKFLLTHKPGTESTRQFPFVVIDMKTGFYVDIFTPYAGKSTSEDLFPARE